MFVIIIRRYVRHDRELQFLDAFRSDLSTHDDFLGETLTKLSDEEDIPPVMSTLFPSAPGYLTYVNVAKWRRWSSFVGQCKMTPGWFDPEIEVRPRERESYSRLSRRSRLRAGTPNSRGRDAQ